METPLLPLPPLLLQPLLILVCGARWVAREPSEGSNQGQGTVSRVLHAECNHVHLVILQTLSSKRDLQMQYNTSKLHIYESVNLLQWSLNKACGFVIQL